MANLVLFLTVAICLPLLLIADPTEMRYRLFPFAWDLGHVVLFAAATWLFFSLRPAIAQRASPGLLAWALLGTAVVSLPIELLQHLTGREASAVDAGRNLLGASLGVMFRPNRGDGERPPPRFLRLARLVVLILLTLAISPLAVNTVDYVESLRAFPVLSNMQSLFETSRWEGERLYSKQFGPFGNRVLRADFAPGEFSSIKLNVFPGDWRGYDFLGFSVFSFAESTLPLHLRINDAHHAQSRWAFDDRYNRVLQIEPGWNRILVGLETVRTQPKRREMDMASIDNLSFFTHWQKRSHTFYFDDLELIAGPAVGVAAD